MVLEPAMLLRNEHAAALNRLPTSSVLSLFNAAEKAELCSRPENYGRNLDPSGKQPSVALVPEPLLLSVRRPKQFSGGALPRLSPLTLPGARRRPNCAGIAQRHAPCRAHQARRV